LPIDASARLAASIGSAQQRPEPDEPGDRQVKVDTRGLLDWTLRSEPATGALR
jgi:hypothetical protein